MVAGKVKNAMGFQRTPANPNPKPNPPQKPPSLTRPSSTKDPQKGSTGAAFSRSFGVYFPRASAQVQPRPPDVTELLHLVEELRERESQLRTELLELKLRKESSAIVPVLENEISNKDSEIDRFKKKIECLEVENEKLRDENEFLHMELCNQNGKYDEKIRVMQAELADIKRSFVEQEEDGSSSCSSSTTPKSVGSSKSSFATRCLRKYPSQNFIFLESVSPKSEVDDQSKSGCEEIREVSNEVMVVKSEGPRVPKPPPRPSSSSTLTSCVSSPVYGSMSNSADRALLVFSNIPAPPPPPPPKASVPPPPPPPPTKGLKPVPAKVRRVPEVVEFYHSLMRRDSNGRRDSADSVQAAGAAAKDMIGEIENRSAHLLAIKTDVETQGDFIRFLIREIEAAAFTDIEDVVPFVKWLDDELSYLVDERAVLKHFDWPEQKADALREAAFGYSDLKKLESEASSYRDDSRQSFRSALKKMSSLFEKLELSVYNLSRIRESAAKRYKTFQIPVNWMLDTGYVNQIKVTSVQLAMKYMKRVLAELEMVGSVVEEEELIVQGVKFAFRVHQFAGGFDSETMGAFQELKDKAQTCNAQYHNQQKFVVRSSTC